MEYYNACTFAKPKNKKKEKLYNGYKDKPNRICAITGQPGAERHEVFGASNRQKSIVLGLQVDLSRAEHERVTNPRNTEDDARIRALKEQGQREFEEMQIKEGNTELQARKAFIHEFGRNYLELIGKEGF